jgi:FixJ family two-component response regulator
VNGDDVCCIGIVDDDRDIVDVYKIIFERMGMPVCLVAYDGHEAVRMFYAADRKPDVILMDERMCAMSGTEATRELVKCDPRPSIILISADAGAMAEAFRAGAKVFLRKPASIKVILEAVRLVRDTGSCHKYYYDGYNGFRAN